MKYIVLVLSICVFCSGCSTIGNIKAEDKPATYYERVKDDETLPMVVAGNNGNKVVYYRHKSHIIKKSTEEMRYGFFQRLQIRIANLSILGFIILVIAILACPSLVIGWLVDIARKIKRALSETVIAIKKSNAKDNDPDLHNALVLYQSPKTKEIVGQIKAKII